jgi:hypothetical protein
MQNLAAEVEGLGRYLIMPGYHHQSRTTISQAVQMTIKIYARAVNIERVMAIIVQNYSRKPWFALRWVEYQITLE